MKIPHGKEDFHDKHLRLPELTLLQELKSALGPDQTVTAESADHGGAAALLGRFLGGVARGFTDV